MINSPQWFVGTAKSLETKQSRNGKPFQILTVTGTKTIRQKGQQPTFEDFDIQFTLFGFVASAVEAMFTEGHQAIVQYNLTSRRNGEYTNISLDVVGVAFLPQPDRRFSDSRPSLPTARPTPRQNAPATVEDGPDPKGDDVPF